MKKLGNIRKLIDVVMTMSNVTKFSNLILFKKMRTYVGLDFMAFLKEKQLSC